MKLTRITLVNWFLLEPVQIEVRDNVAFLGDNGAGKSSIIDAIQTVLFGGNKRHINLNASSSEKRSNDRDIKSYCLGAFEPQDSNDSTHTSRLRDECFTYAALTFTKDDGSYVNLILGIEARESDRNESYPIRAILSGDKAIGLSDFIHTKQEHEKEAMNPEVVMQRFNISKSSENNSFDIVTFTKSGEYLEQLAHSLSPENTHQKIDPEYLIRVLSKSISLKELNNISDFVDNFILEPSNINIQRLKSQQKKYESITIEIQKAAKKLEDLSYISKRIKRSFLKTKEGLSLSWLILEQKLENEYECKDEHYNRRKDAVLTLRALHRELKKDEARVVFLEDELLELNRQINEDEPQKRKRELNDKIKKLRSEKTALEGKIRELFVMLNEMKASDYDVLKSEEITALVMRISESLRNENHIKTDTHLLSYFENIKQIKEKVRSKQGEILAESQTLKDQITELVNNITAAKEGKPNLTTSTMQLIAYLKQHNIEAVPACSLVEISEKTWQPSIEALLSSDLEALIVDESDEVEAYRLYMELRKSPRSLYGAKVVKTSRIKDLNVSLQQGYAAQLISSDNATALKFMQYKLGRFKLVKTEKELKHNRFAITKDGMLSNDVTVTGMNLKTAYKIGKDQTKNIESWKIEKEKLEVERLSLEPSINKLDKIYNTNIKLGNYDWETQIFGSINLKVGKLEGQITEHTLEESKIDLTHLTVLKDTVEKHGKEKEDLKMKNKINDREIGIQKKTSKIEKKLISESLTRSLELKEEQSQIIDHKDYDPATTDEIQIKHEDRSREELEGLFDKVSKKAEELLSDAEISFRSYQERNTDSFDENVLGLFKTDLTLLDEKICDEKDSIEKFNLAPHEEAAKNSEEAINTLFKSEVISELKRL